jgi:hypothetical protein
MAVIVVLWLAAVLITLSRPYTDHVPVAAVPAPLTTEPFVYGCSAPLGAPDVVLKFGQRPGDAVPSRPGCQNPRHARRVLAGLDVGLTVLVVAALGTWSLRRRSTSER